jgi:hypothetical protein
MAVTALSRVKRSRLSIRGYYLRAYLSLLRFAVRYASITAQTTILEYETHRA